MKTISSPQKGTLRVAQIPDESVQETIYPYQFDLNITDGGEFLDDAIRMKDQPLGETDKQKE